MVRPGLGIKTVNWSDRFIVTIKVIPANKGKIGRQAKERDSQSCEVQEGNRTTEHEIKKARRQEDRGLRQRDGV